jgi:hypothetical protein
MTNYMILADLEAEQINGGFGSFFSYSSKSMKSVGTWVGQSNTSNNLGLGIVGLGNAQSIQENSALVGTILA